MRLIDADKLETDTIYATHLSHAESVYHYTYSERAISEAPTVEAIPIERVEKLVVQIKELSNDNPSYWNVCDVVDRQKVLETIEEMLEKWEKENG